MLAHGSQQFVSMDFINIVLQAGTRRGHKVLTQSPPALYVVILLERSFDLTCFCFALPRPKPAHQPHLRLASPKPMPSTPEPG
jgi:hypothetical protein